MHFFIYIILFLSFIFLLRKWKSESRKRLPPSPWKLPIIGNLHQVAGIPHRVLNDLAKKYGPLMHLQLGEICTIVVSSPETVKQIMKTHDVTFASRPKFLVTDIICHGGADITFCPYGDFWRQMRKICTLEVMSSRNVRAFSSIRREEVVHLINAVRSTPPGEPVNVTERIFWFSSSMITRTAFGQVFKNQDKFIQVIKQVLHLAEGNYVTDVFPSLKFLHSLSGMTRKIKEVSRNFDDIVENVISEHKENLALGKTNGALGGEDLIDVMIRKMTDGSADLPITHDSIKAIIFDLFTAGMETTSSTIVWTMVEIVRNPSVLAKAQAEVREAFKENGSFDEKDVEQLSYLKLVVKEALRLHPPIPVIPRECREETNINGYTIPLKARVLVNVWALGRDPKYWDDSETFKPERFEQCSVDFIANNFEYLPFGGGKRICPGISFGLPNVYLPLAQLLYHFDWKLPAGIKPSDINMTEANGITAPIKDDLCLIATPYQ